MELLYPAAASDHDAIADLLRTCGLPYQDIAAHLPHFTVARDDGRLVGVIGLEVHGTDGLLRSLAVPPERRGQGVARRLYASAIAQARRLGLERLYVLTTSAEGFFGLLGFRAVQRDDVPETIRGTAEFRTLCPADAACLVRVVPRA